MPTMEQYEKAIAAADRAGDKEAAMSLIQDASKLMTGSGSFMEKLGAGFMDVGLAGKQMLGMTTPEEIKEHNRMAERATGGTIGGTLTRALPMAMTAFLPGGQRVAGAAGYGALAGMMSPTEDENVLAGKATQGLLGAAAGGAFQGAANAAAPVLKKTLSKARDFLPGGARRVAERDFAASIPEAERAAAQQTLQGATAARTPPMAAGTTGAPISTAAALGAANRGGPMPESAARLLAAEREAREAGGMLGQRFRDLDETAAQARWGHLEQNVGGDVAALKRTKDDVYENFLLNAKMRTPFDPKDKLWREMQDALTDEHNPAIRGELERIAQQYLSAKGAGDFKSLHGVRMEAFDDALKRLYSTDTKAANNLRHKIQDFESIFDKEMEKSLGPGRKWANFRDEYSNAAAAEGQARRGEEFLGTARTWNETPGGVPQLTGKRQQMAALATEADDFGRPAVSPGASDALQTVRREITEQMQPANVGPRGSATAQNLNPTSPVLAKAIQAQQRANQGLLTPWNVAVTGGAAAMGNPLAGVGIVAGRGLLDRRALSIADELMQIYADPQQAVQALARANLPQQVKDGVMAVLAKRAGAQGAAGAAVQSTNEPQEQ